MSYVWVFIGGGVGSMFRFGISRLYPFTGDGFPVATILANVISSFILGLFLGVVIRYNIPYQHRLLLLTGFCGGFSTFSTFSAEGIALMQKGHLFMALLYIVISIILGLTAVFLGMKLIPVE